MKKFSKLVMAFSIIIFSLLIVSINSFAQGPSDPGFPDDPGGDPDAPIDGGIVLLVAAGVLYGIKRVRTEKAKRTINLMDSIH
jgi:hypothetical protein